MSIAIPNLGVQVNTDVLSGGEEIMIKRLANKSGKGERLSETEVSFLLSMVFRSNIRAQLN